MVTGGLDTPALMVAHMSPLTGAVIMLAVAVIAVALLQSLKLSSVLGYLAAGMAVGPQGLGIIHDPSPALPVAEFGIVFLLFLIGLELSFERLRAMRSQVFGVGTAQVLITALAIGLCVHAMDYSTATALIVGGGLALSSTAIVLQVLTETGERASQTGRLSLAVLILQDLAVIPLLVIVPVLGRENHAMGTELGLAAVKTVVGLAVLVIAGRLLLRPLFRFIAALRHTELFSATTLLVVLGISWAAHTAGLSLALGAFMAGLLVAETEFKPQVEADILPFKGLLLGLFFMTVGMSINLRLIVEYFPAIMGSTLLLMSAKATIVFILCRAAGFSRGASLHGGLLLSQGGEFAFVLFQLASAQGILHAEFAQSLMMVVTLSMALTPLAAMLGKRLAQTLEGRARPDQINEETLDLSDHVIITGFGRVGRTVARLLEAEQLSYVALDMDPATVARKRRQGIPVFYGDASRAPVLNALGLARARAVIVTHNDMRVAERTVRAVREQSRDVPIIARAVNIEQVQNLESAGANLAVAEMLETSLHLGGALLRAVGVAEHEVSRVLESFRAENYALARSTEAEEIQ